MRDASCGQGRRYGALRRSRTRPALWYAAIAVVLAPPAGCFHGAQPGDDPTPGNQPPTIIDLTASPATITTSESSTVGVTASDPDGDTLTYSWFQNSPGGILTGSGASVTDWPASCCLGTWAITVTVSDANGGSTQSSVNVTVQ